MTELYTAIVTYRDCDESYIKSHLEAASEKELVEKITALDYDWNSTIGGGDFLYRYGIVCTYIEEEDGYIYTSICNYSIKVHLEKMHSQAAGCIEAH